MRLGRRGDTGVSIDLKETRAGSYKLSLQTMQDGKKRANKQGYEFGLHIEFNDESGDFIAGFAVVPWEIYEELKRGYEEHYEDKTHMD